MSSSLQSRLSTVLWIYEEKVENCWKYFSLGKLLEWLLHNRRKNPASRVNIWKALILLLLLFSLNYLWLPFSAYSSLLAIKHCLSSSVLLLKLLHSQKNEQWSAIPHFELPLEISAVDTSSQGHKIMVINRHAVICNEIRSHHRVSAVAFKALEQPVDEHYTCMTLNTHTRSITVKL